MKTTRISLLSGAALDWLVTQLEHADCTVAAYSTDWAIGGPIIERTKMWVGPLENGGSWGAKLSGNYHYATTPLVAAMRCYVASKLGNTVEIPDNL